MRVQLGRTPPAMVGLVLGVLLTAWVPAAPTRAAATEWVVTSTGDGTGCSPSSCTLRAAILGANASAGPDLIRFDIPPGGPQTITVGLKGAQPLPPITGSDVVLDGSTQPGGGARGIRIHDGDKGDGEDGLALDGQRITVHGFIITGFDVSAIHVRTGSAGNVITGNWIGTADGITAVGTGGKSVLIRGAGGNRIGGTTAAERNVISGSVSDGLELRDTNNNVVIGNYVGMTADGLGRLPNRNGIRVTGTSRGNRVGGTTPEERNIVSGNNGIGVQLLGHLQADGSCKAPRENLVTGNYLGINVNGVRPGSLGNRGEGMQLSVCAQFNTIGGTQPGARNIVSGNGADGVELDSSGGPGGAMAVCDNIVQGNYVGSDPTGMLAVPNADDGIGVDNGACNNTIGGSEAGAGNLVSGNYNDGIDIARPGSSGNRVEGNLIGLSADGSTVLRNTQNGVQIRHKAQANVVANNVISANLQNGVLLYGYLTEGNIVTGNRIGTSASGTLVRGNKQHGVWILDGPKGNRIEGNRIVGNTLDGVAVEKLPESIYTTRENRITGNEMRSNGGLGIDLVPSDGPNARNGNNAEASVGNSGIDAPSITQATATSVAGQAPAGGRVELFEALPDGENAAEGWRLVGEVDAAADGTWCADGLSIATTLVTASVTDAASNTSEFAVAAPVTGTGSVCPEPPDPSVLFADEFGGQDGSAPSNWEVRRSAAGAGSGATIRDGQLQVAVVLAPEQDGTTQYVQARAKPVQPTWSGGPVLIRWDTSTAGTATQMASLVLTPSAATGNALSQADYLRIRIASGKLSIISRKAGGAASTLWIGDVAPAAELRAFELRLSSSALTLSEGPAGSRVVRADAIAHDLGWSTGHVYLHASTSSLQTFTQPFDNVQFVDGTIGQ